MRHSIGSAGRADAGPRRYSFGGSGGIKVESQTATYRSVQYCLCDNSKYYLIITLSRAYICGVIPYSREYVISVYADYGRFSYIPSLGESVRLW